MSMTQQRRVVNKKNARERRLWLGLDIGEHAVMLRLVRVRLGLDLHVASLLGGLSYRYLRELERGVKPMYQDRFEAVLYKYHAYEKKGDAR